MPVLPVAFAGGDEGAWRVRSVSAVVGTPLPTVERLAVLEGARDAPPGATWTLLGVVRLERYEHPLECTGRMPGPSDWYSAGLRIGSGSPCGPFRPAARSG